MLSSYVTHSPYLSSLHSFLLLRQALDADGSGDISVDELEEPLISIGVVASKEDLIAMINKYDSSGDGEIDFQEFVKMVMTKEEGENNAMLKLFEEFSEGLLGDKVRSLVSGSCSTTLVPALTLRSLDFVCRRCCPSQRWFICIHVSSSSTPS